jgi:hypothetical protein
MVLYHNPRKNYDKTCRYHEPSKTCPNKDNGTLANMKSKKES